MLDKKDTVRRTMSTYWYGTIRYLNNRWYSFMGMREALGTKLCLYIVLAQHLTKGFTYGGGSGGIIGTPIPFLFKSYTSGYSLDAIQIQIYRNIALSPWSLKPLIGIVADTVSLYGYHKLPYIFVATMAAIAACLILATCWPVAPVIATALLFVLYLACATTDLLVESRYSERISMNPSQGPNITSFVWLGIAAGQIFSSIPVGILLEHVEPHWLYYIAVVPLALVLVPTLKNWLGDQLHTNSVPFAADDINAPNSDPISNCCGPCCWFSYDHDDSSIVVTETETETYTASGSTQIPSSSDDDEGESESEGEVAIQRRIWSTPVVGIKIGKIQREWKYILLALCVALISIGTSIMGMAQVHPNYICIASLIGIVVMIIGFRELIGGVTARFQTFIMIQGMFSMSISSAEFFFMTDTAEQYPEGPHFSKTFYVVAIGITASVCAIIGSLSYLMFMQSWRYRSVFYFSNIVSVALGLLNVVFFKRWNRLVGIPDELFVLGSEVLQVIVGTWNSAPITIAMASLCPRDIEAIMYALLAGSSNLCGSLSQYTGASLLLYLGVNPRGAIGETQQFENLWLASLISTLLPLVTIALIPFLIPDKGQKESLLETVTEEDDNVNYRIDDAELARVESFISSGDDDDDTTELGSISNTDDTPHQTAV